MIKKKNKKKKKKREKTNRIVADVDDADETGKEGTAVVSKDRDVEFRGEGETDGVFKVLEVGARALSEARKLVELVVGRS